MSLQYQTEKEPIETPTEAQDENVQRAQAVVPIYSYILVACLIVVALCQFSVDGASSILLGGEKSILLAGFDKTAFAHGEYWRILTGSALHGGLIHLGFNCYALYVLGKLIEVLSNRAHLAIVFLLSALGGSLLSYYFLPDGISVGASGGIVGFLGYMAAYGFVRRKLLPPSFLKGMIFNIGFIALYGILINMKSEDLHVAIDNYGHLGGLIVGVIYGLIQIPKDLYKDPRVVSKATEFLGLASLGIFIATCLFSILLIFRIV